MELDPNSNLVLLVAKETFTPYKKGEVFGVTPEVAEKLLTRDMTMTDFGPKYPVVKCRRFDPKQDMELLLQNGTLNQREHEKLVAKLHPSSKKNKSEE